MRGFVGFLSSIAFLHFSSVIYAQEMDKSFTKKDLDYPTYIGLIGKNNLEYSAEKFNMHLADAELLSAKIFPDPELDIGFFDNGERRINMGYGFSSALSWTLELGGKRKARIDVANNQTEMTKLLLEDYFRNLRADATLAYLEAILNRHLLNVQLNSYQQMKKLSEADSIRFQLGSISQVNARQSKLEAGMMLNGVYAAQAEWQASLAGLSLLLGKRDGDTIWLPKENLTGFDRKFKLHDLIQVAKNNRADLKAALQNKNLSHSMIKLAKANRAIDLGLSIGLDYNSPATNDIAPTPAFTTVSAGISIPIKLSNTRPGEFRAAQYEEMQAEQRYKHIELAIQTEVIQAFYNYQATQKQVSKFNTGLLIEAKAVLDGRVYSYERGETSLLEVLDAQRTYNEVQQSYYQTTYSHAAALIELERKAGIWDINF